MHATVQRCAERRTLRFAPTKFQLDFEVVALKAIEKCSPLAVLKEGCFSSTRATWKHVQKYGLITAYENDKAVKK